MSRRFSDRELRVLAASVNRADLPVSELAKDLKLREHTVRYILANLKQRGEIYARVPFLNLYALGYCDFAVYFSLAPAKKSRIQDALKVLKHESSVTWMASLGGEFQYCMVITVTSALEVPALLDRLAKENGVILNSSILSLRRCFVSLGRRHLWNGTKGPYLKMTAGVNAQPLKEIDQRILREMSLGKYESLRDVAARIKEPIATVSRRVRELQASGVIAGYVYRINLAAAGYTLHRLLLQVIGDIPEARERLNDYCARELRIIHFIECFGTWNFELGIEVKRAAEVAEIRDSVIETIGGTGRHQVSVKIVQLLESMKYEPFCI